MLKEELLSFIMVIVVISVAANSRGATYYVDRSSIGGKSSDSNKGTKSSPWKTAIKGFESAKPGDTVYFRKGKYRVNQPVSNFAHGATASNRIVFKALSGESVLISAMQPRENTSFWKRETGQIYSTPITRQSKVTKNDVGRIPNVSQSGVPLMLMTEAGENGGPGDLKGPGQWARSVKTWKIYVWAKGGGNPGNYRTEISEFPQGGRDIIHLDADVKNDKAQPNYLTFENLTFEGGYYPFNIESDHITIKGCTIRNCYGDGIKVGGPTKPKDPLNPEADPDYYNSEHGLVENCDIYHFGEAGIDLTGGDDWIIRGNRIHDNTPNRGDLVNSDNPMGTKGTGIMMKNNVKDALVEDNELYDMVNKDMGAITIGGDTQVLGGAVDVIVRDNRIYDVSAHYVVTFQGAHNSQFTGNIVENCTLSKQIIRVRSTADKSVFKNKNCKIKNNHFFKNKVDDNGWSDQIRLYTNSFENFEIDGDTLDPKKTYIYKGKRRSLAEFQKIGFEKNAKVSKASELAPDTSKNEDDNKAPKEDPAPSEPAPPKGGGMVLVDDSLDKSTDGDEKGSGRFVSGGGWQSEGGKIVFDAGRKLTNGYFEAKMRGWTAPASGEDKSHPLSGWENKSQYSEETQEGSYWNWRIGDNYSVFKLLAAPQGFSTFEQTRKGLSSKVNSGQPSSWHTYRVQWNSGTVEFIFNGTVLKSWEFDRFSIRYFTIGKDDLYGVTNPAPIISDVKIVDLSAATTKNVESAQISGSGAEIRETSSIAEATITNPASARAAVPTPVNHGPGTPISVTTYEDAEDNKVSGWYAYNDGTIENIKGNASSDGRFIKITGEIDNDVFRLGKEDGSSWNNATEFFAEFSVAFDQAGAGAIYIEVATSNGVKFIVYTADTIHMKKTAKLANINLGNIADGRWHTILRNLEDDLAKAFPDIQLESVKGLYVYGSLRLDNVKLIDFDTDRIN